MFAVVKTGGKQYRVKENQVVLVEKILGQQGDVIALDSVLLLEDGNEITIGKPVVDGAKVVASIVEQTRGDKVIIFKKKRRHTYRRKKGHRQDLTVLRVEQIAKPGEAVRSVTPASKKEPVKKVAAKPASDSGVEGEAKVTEKVVAAKAKAKKEAKVAKVDEVEKKPGAKKTVKKAAKES